MTLLEELKIFVKNILYWIFSFVGFSFFFFIFGLKKAAIFGKNYFLPLPTENSFSVQVFKMMERNFMPSGVQLIVTNPWSGFIVQLEIAIILAFIVTFPLFLYKIIKYISPALFEHEKKAILKTTAAFTVLFISGCLFAYYYMIPLTFKFMYPFATSLGIVTFFSLDTFMAWVITILITTGIIFLLPIFIIVLTYLRIVNPDFWRKKWRPAFLSLLIFCAIITPDQTGVTMMLLFVPLAILYTGGAILAGKF
ncbi:MAG: twin-arginine translocase subunit TatC [Candidatus Parcubacteria bacterium]|nr:twin-arginine translocase subunit TatC [Candidatus Parcubacteria bacterium]